MKNINDWITENFLPSERENKLSELKQIVLSDRASEVGVEPEVIPTLKEIENKRDYKTVYLVIATLANLCAATEERIIDLLTGYLWDEEEAGHIKRSA